MSQPIAARLVALLFAASLPAAAALHAEADLGLFTTHSDVGNPKRTGSVLFEPLSQAYQVAGGGANMWSTNDALHFVWRRVWGDVAIAATIDWIGSGVDPHRKACLLIRQSLAPDSAYADAALHGDGLTSLQYRESEGGMTREIQSNYRGPRRLQIEKRGSYVSMSLSNGSSPLQPAGGSFRLVLQEPFYIGVGVCSHNDNVLESARFSDVLITPLNPIESQLKPRFASTLETVAIASKDRRVTWWSTNLIEAPNWCRDGTNLVFNSKGQLFQVPVAGGEPRRIDTGVATRINNDHGISPDGTTLVISDQSQGDRKSRIYTLPLSGGVPHQVTALGPSYWHGWSPDGKTLAYCADRNGEFDVYTVPAAGGTETRLTTAKGLDDGPEFSPDGHWIYFNSDRAGRMQIWRMHADGSNQEPYIADEWNNWFAHPSPDGKWVVFLSYPPEIKGHPENKDVLLRLMATSTGRIEVLAKLFGGQGTINVPSWSPDSKKVAFVSYQLIP